MYQRASRSRVFFPHPISVCSTCSLFVQLGSGMGAYSTHHTKGCCWCRCVPAFVCFAGIGCWVCKCLVRRGRRTVASEALSAVCEDTLLDQ